MKGNVPFWHLVKEVAVNQANTPFTCLNATRHVTTKELKPTDHH